jgi:aminopeptidase N
LFHQWFGDLVTCESWSNTPLNESFATYGEYIWKDYKYGREEADYSRAFDLNVYLRESKTKQVNLIRFEYDKIDDMFDRHSYQKGGCILHLLRKELGDDAFFASLKLYLEKNKFQPVEVHNLRLAFEEVTGRDLNWFFNQWFMDRGHPVLDITYQYDASAKNVTVTIRQQQDTSGIRLFRLNLETDIYLANSVEHKKIVVTKKEETFTFPVNEKPLLVNVDATKTLVGQKFDYHSAAEWLYQYYHAPLYLDRLEAVKAVPDNYAANSPEAKLILDAANDKHWHIRTTAIKKIKLPAHPDSTELQKLLMNIARNDSKSSVRAAAINKLNEQFSGNSLTGFYKELLNDSSYLVMTAAMEALSERDSTAALAFALKQEQSKELEIIEMNSGLYANYGNANQANYMHQIIQNANNDNLYSLLGNYGDYIIRQSDEKILNKGIDVLGDKAKNAQPWYNRFAAMQSLAELSSTLQNKKADAVRKNIVLEQEKFSTLLQKCSDSMASIMKAETDPSLRRIYDNSNQK